MAEGRSVGDAEAAAGMRKKGGKGVAFAAKVLHACFSAPDQREKGEKGRKKCNNGDATPSVQKSSKSVIRDSLARGVEQRWRGMRREKRLWLASLKGNLVGRRCHESNFSTVNGIIGGLTTFQVQSSAPHL